MKLKNNAKKRPKFNFGRFNYFLGVWNLINKKIVKNAQAPTEEKVPPIINK